MKVYQSKLYFIVMGGIGNQLFQFANAFSLGKKNNLEIYPEKNFAFISNLKFKRKFKLNRIINILKNINIFTQLKIILFFIFRKIKIKTNFNFISEKNHKQFLPIDNVSSAKDNIVLGYWQSERYFSDYTDEIVKQINLPEKGSKPFNDLLSLIKVSNSVALCIRIYEELPGDKSFVGGEENIEFYNNSIKQVMKYNPDAVFFVFSQKNYPILEKLKINNSVYFITEENYPFDELYNLSLISNCKSHIISNSSFYWWGAWIAEAKKKSNLIISSKKFSNKDAIPSRWILL